MSDRKPPWALQAQLDTHSWKKENDSKIPLSTGIVLCLTCALNDGERLGHRFVKLSAHGYVNCITWSNNEWWLGLSCRLPACLLSARIRPPLGEWDCMREQSRFSCYHIFAPHEAQVMLQLARRSLWQRFAQFSAHTCTHEYFMNGEWASPLLPFANLPPARSALPWEMGNVCEANPASPILIYGHHCGHEWYCRTRTLCPLWCRFVRLSVHLFKGDLRTVTELFSLCP